MIVDEIRRAWAEDPQRVVLAAIGTVLAVPVLWVMAVAYLTVGAALVGAL